MQKQCRKDAEKKQLQSNIEGNIITKEYSFYGFMLNPGKLEGVYMLAVLAKTTLQCGSTCHNSVGSAVGP
jgi:hypothetical protein